MDTLSYNNNIIITDLIVVITTPFLLRVQQ